MDRLFDTLAWLLLWALGWLLECYQALRAAVAAAMVTVGEVFTQLAEQIGRAIASFLLVVAVVAVAAVAACALVIAGRRRAVAPAAA